MFNSQAMTASRCFVLPSPVIDDILSSESRSSIMVEGTPGPVVKVRNSKRVRMQLYILCDISFLLNSALS